MTLESYASYSSSRQIQDRLAIRAYQKDNNGERPGGSAATLEAWAVGDRFTALNTLEEVAGRPAKEVLGSEYFKLAYDAPEIGNSTIWEKVDAAREAGKAALPALVEQEAHVGVVVESVQTGVNEDVPQRGWSALDGLLDVQG